MHATGKRDFGKSLLTCTVIVVSAATLTWSDFQPKNQTMEERLEACENSMISSKMPI